MAMSDFFSKYANYHQKPIQFARAGTIDGYDATMTVPSVCVTSQINCDDVTMLSREQKRPWRQRRNDRSISVCSGAVCSEHKIACKK